MYTVLVLCESSNAVITRLPLPRTRGIKHFNSQSFNSSSPRRLMQSSNINIYFLHRHVYMWVPCFCRLKSALEADDLPTIVEIWSFVTKSSSRFFLAFKWHLHSGSTTVDGPLLSQKLPFSRKLQNFYWELQDKTPIYLEEFCCSKIRCWASQFAFSSSNWRRFSSNSLCCASKFFFICSWRRCSCRRLWTVRKCRKHSNFWNCTNKHHQLNLLIQHNYVLYFSSEKGAQTINSKVTGTANNRHEKIINPIASFYS